DLQTGVKVAAIEDTGNELRILLDGGTPVIADYAAIGIGAQPNIELAHAAGIETHDGVIVDEFGRSSDPAVFAAGDVIGPSLASVAIDQGREALCGALGLDFSAHVDQIPAAAVYGLPEVARAGKSEEECRAEAIPHVIGRCELGAIPRGVIAGQEGLLKLVFHAGTGVLLGVHVICEIASEITGTGQAMIHNQATVEDIVRMAYNTPTYTYGYKLAATDTLTRMHPDVLLAMRLPSRAHRV
ncbi:MAG: FAD-dependent oxidoreductase, partial [Streptosporangiaceae bacterium]